MLRATLAAFLVAFVATAGVAAPAAAAAPVPRVALVVGPVGAVTSQYRALANEAASAARMNSPIARRYSSDSSSTGVCERRGFQGDDDLRRRNALRREHLSGERDGGQRRRGQKEDASQSADERT